MRQLLVSCQVWLTASKLEDIATVAQCQLVLIHFDLDILCRIERTFSLDRIFECVHRGKVDRAFVIQLPGIACGNVLIDDTGSENIE